MYLTGVRTLLQMPDEYSTISLPWADLAQVPRSERCRLGHAGPGWPCLGASDRREGPCMHLFRNVRRHGIGYSRLFSALQGPNPGHFPIYRPHVPVETQGRARRTSSHFSGILHANPISERVVRISPAWEESVLQRFRTFTPAPDHK